jgi:hypothetical protein
MKSRRRIAFPTAQAYADDEGNYSRVLMSAEWGLEVQLHSNNIEPPMSALGQNLPKLDVRIRSAFPLVTTKSRTSQ